MRDPFGKVDEEQLNGGEIVALEERDWKLILPYLEENERLFGVSIQKNLLTVQGKQLSPFKAYRKVRPKQTKVNSLGLRNGRNKDTGSESRQCKKITSNKQQPPAGAFLCSPIAQKYT